MSYRTLIKQEQPIFYRILEHSFRDNKKSHAYLLVGQKTREVIQYLSMALLCPHDILACEECEVCYRVKTDQYVDLIHFNGEEETIKKNQIEYVQKTFSKTAVEGHGKIYVLEHIDHATPEAMNALLKMLEEPVDGIYAIFTCENEHQVLPTIVSRCQVIRLKLTSKIQLKKMLEDEITDEEMRNVIVALSKDKNEALSLYNADLLRELMIEAFNFVEDDLYAHENLMINAQTHVFKTYKDRETIRFFLNIVLLIYKEKLYQRQDIFIKYIDFINKPCQQEDLIRKIEKLLETINLLEENANVSLLMDRLMYRL